MKKALGVIAVLAAVVLLACMASSATADTRIELLDFDPADGLVLKVGDTHTFEIEVKQGKAFVLAMAMPDAYYPGRSIIWRGNDIVHRDNSGLLQLTMTATSPTADLGLVCGWPEPDDPCWDPGVAPVSIVAGVRFEKGEVLTERFDFQVVVVEP